MNWTGLLLDNRYQLDSFAGAGASGSVFQARDVWNRNEVVAAKIFPHQSRKSALHLYKEYSLFASAPHPSLIRLHSVGYDPEKGLPYLISEWVNAPDADQINWRESNTTLYLFAVELFRALTFLHTRNITHHDIKPSNCKVIVTGDNCRIKLLDFGFAAKGKRSRNMQGTIDYLPPEQYSEYYNPPMMDMYAAGIMLYQLAVGHVPYSDLSPLQALRKRGECPLPDLRSEAPWIAQPFADIIATLTDPNQNLRPISSYATLEQLISLSDTFDASITKEDFSIYLHHYIPNHELTKELDQNIENADGDSRFFEVSSVTQSDLALQVAGWFTHRQSVGIPAVVMTSLDPAIRSYIERWIQSNRKDGIPSIIGLLPDQIDTPVEHELPDSGYRSKILVTKKPEELDFLLRDAPSSSKFRLPRRNQKECQWFVKQLLPGIVAPDVWYNSLYIRSSGIDSFVRLRLSEEYTIGRLSMSGDGWVAQAETAVVELPHDLSRYFTQKYANLDSLQQNILNHISLFPHGISHAFLAQLLPLELNKLKRHLLSTEISELATNVPNESGIVEVSQTAVRRLIRKNPAPEVIQSIQTALASVRQNHKTPLWVLSASIQFASLLENMNDLEQFLIEWFDRFPGESLRSDTVEDVSGHLAKTNLSPLLRALIQLQRSSYLSGIGLKEEAISALDTVFQNQAIPARFRAKAGNELAAMQHQRGNREAAEVCFKKVAEISQFDAPGQFAFTLASLAQLATVRQDWQQAESYSRQALLLSPHGSISIERLYALYVQGMIEFYSRHNMAAAANWWRQATEIANEIGHQTLLCNLLNNLGVAAAMQGKNRSAIKYWNRTIQVAQEIGFSSRLSATLVNVGVKKFEAGKLAEAEQYYLQGLTLFKRNENVADSADCLNNLTELEFCRAHYSLAGYYNDAACKSAEITGNVDLILASYFQRTELYYFSGQIENAKKLLSTLQQNVDPSNRFSVNRIQLLRRLLEVKSAEKKQTFEWDPEIFGDGQLELIEEATLRYLALSVSTHLTESQYRELADRLYRLAVETQHHWFLMWGLYHRTVTNENHELVKNWEALVKQSNGYPEISWRVLWRLGKAMQSQGEIVPARICFKRGVQILKQVANSFREEEANHYLQQDEHLMFRKDVLANAKISQ